MAIQHNMTTFMGRQLRDFDGVLDDPSALVYRISAKHNDDIRAALEHLLRDPNAPRLTGLVIGDWPTPQEEPPTNLLTRLIDARDSLQALEVFFLGDISYEQCEISWIQQCDVSPLLEAYPNLLHFGARGGAGLSFRKIKHNNLRSLIVETGGLSAKTLQELCALDLPLLERLELWLGIDSYGGDVTVKDLEKIFNAEAFPQLGHLGLRNSMITDEICAALRGAKIMESLVGLDLSLGTLSDVGAAHLLANEEIKDLESLNLSHHYLSHSMIEQLKAAFPKLGLNLDNALGEQEKDRYCQTTE